MNDHPIVLVLSAYPPPGGGDIRTGEQVIRAIHHAVREAAPDAEVLATDTFMMDVPIAESIREAVNAADVVIADISDGIPGIMFEVGAAQAAGKPIVQIASTASRIPYDVAGTRVILYGPSLEALPTLRAHVRAMVSEALADPISYRSAANKPTTETVFISYAHADRDYMDRLHVHLAPLRREGLIDLWNDRRIQAGDRWREEIRTALERARIAILLLSADFLASSFIVENELPPLLHQAEVGGTKIISVILSPCRYLRDRRLSAFQAAHDAGQPLAAMTEAEQEAVWDDVAQIVEVLVGGSPGVDR